MRENDGQRGRPWSRMAAVGLIGALLAMPAAAQDDERFRPAFFDTSMAEVSRIVAEVLQRTIIADPQTRKVLITYRSEREISGEEMWELFLRLVDENGLTAVESAGVWRILPSPEPPSPPAPAPNFDFPVPDMPNPVLQSPVLQNPGLQRADPPAPAAE